MNENETVEATTHDRTWILPFGGEVEADLKYQTKDSIVLAALARLGDVEPKSDPAGRDDLFFSGEQRFRNCRRLFYYSSVERLRRVSERDLPLWWGSLFHDAQEVFYVLTRLRRSVSIAQARNAAQNYLGAKLPERTSIGVQRMLWIQVGEAFDAYLDRWGLSQSPGEDHVADTNLSYLGIESRAFYPIRNPDTGGTSRFFRGGIKIDGLVRGRDDGLLYLLERKTASRVDAAYVDRLWTDVQIRRYARALSELIGEEIVGSIYDIAVKPPKYLTPKEAYTEPEDAFEDRVHVKLLESRTALIKKKLALKEPREPTEEEFEKDEARVRGLKTMQREVRHAETDDEYRERCRSHFRKLDSFHRLVILFAGDDLDDVERETWETTQQIIDARRRGRWSRNRSQCFNYNRACDFLPLCKSHVDTISTDLTETALDNGEPLASLYERRKASSAELDEGPMTWIDEKGASAYDEPDRSGFVSETAEELDLPTGADVPDIQF